MGLPPVSIVFTTFRLFGSMRETVPSAWFEAHTEPNPNATSQGLRPTWILFVTRKCLTSTRTIAFPVQSSTQSAPAPAAIPHGFSPTRIRFTTRFVAGFTFASAPSA